MPIKGVGLPLGNTDAQIVYGREAVVPGISRLPGDVPGDGTSQQEDSRSPARRPAPDYPGIETSRVRTSA
jgi:hypothetical protein